MSDDDILSMEAEERFTPSPRKNDDGRLAAEVARHLMADGFANQMLQAFERRASLVLGDLALTSNPSPQAAAGVASGFSVGTEAGEASRVPPSSAAWHLIEPFDPDGEEASINRWITRLDMLGDMHGWSGKERVLASQARLDGAAKRWFYRLDRINYEWEEWRGVLKGAFPLRNNFGAMVEELALRRKQSKETMTEYYRDKVALCARVGITGENAVSCVVYGLPEAHRANAHAALPLRRCITISWRGWRRTTGRHRRQGLRPLE
ncbi:hypothetical protein RI129_001047 [Pyrocoelia pectoralis]|uniref:Retrotransposon gag domain-containing protein n=1 Tax=Pyrocoelia pectoralis TaxID=417401 RepID=A0AAN7ZWN3_9COLE